MTTEAEEGNFDYLGRAVFGARTALGLSQADVAARGGPSDTIQSQIERGEWRSKRPAATLAKIDKGLGWPSGTAARVAYERFDPNTLPAQLQLGRLVIRGVDDLPEPHWTHEEATAFFERRVQELRAQRNHAAHRLDAAAAELEAATKELEKAEQDLQRQRWIIAHQAIAPVSPEDAVQQLAATSRRLIEVLDLAMGTGALNPEAVVELRDAVSRALENAHRASEVADEAGMPSVQLVLEDTLRQLERVVASEPLGRHDFAIAAHEEGSIAGEQESHHST